MAASITSIWHVPPQLTYLISIPRMSASKTKKAASSEEKDTITVEADMIEVLIASLGPSNFNMSLYKKMVHFTSSGRTISSFEHFFRDRKKKAIAMLAANPGINNVSRSICYRCGSLERQRSE